MKKLIIFLIAFVASFIMAVNIQAQEASSSAAAKYGVTFPVSELGNCGSLSQCRTFCSDPLNKDACIAFAKKKGFYKEKGFSSNKTAIKNAIAIAAKQELGCDSEEACKSFCGEQANWEKCGEFAKKHNLGGGQTQDPTKSEIIIKAKDILGCDTYESCKGFCSKDANRTKCDEFAKLVGLRGGVEKKGPGGCTTVETCKAYCLETGNTAECSKLGVKVDQSKGPQGLPAKPSTTSGNIVPYSTPNPDYARKCVDYGCTWTGTTCNCQNRSPLPSYTPKPSNTPYPQNTPYPSSSPISYEQYCQDKGGTWTGTTCSFTSGNTGTTSSVKGASIP